MKRILALCIIFVISLIVGGCGEKSQSPVLRVAMPYSDKVQDPDTNYYINWLEDKTGLDIEISLIRQKGVTGYLDTLFSSDLDVDVVFFGEDFTMKKHLKVIQTERIVPYIRKKIWSI